MRTIRNKPEKYPIDGSRDALWMATAAPAPATKPLTEHMHCDVVVVGGGLTGLTAALELTNQHLSVSVLEASTLGFGASGRSGGQVNLGLNLKPSALLEKFGPDDGARLINLVVNTPKRVFELIEKHKLACDPVQNGWVQGAFTRQQLSVQEDLARDYEQHGYTFTKLDAQSVTTRTGTDRYLGGLYCESAGSLQPLSYTRELARVAINNGAKVFTESPVTGLTSSNDNSSQWIVTTPHGQVRCKHILLCTNGYTDQLVTGLKSKVVPVRSVLTATEPLSESLQQQVLPNQVTFVDKRRLVLYFRYDRFGRLCVGDHGPMRDAFSLNDFKAVKERAIEIFPQLKNVRWDYHWGGRVAMTKSTLPFLYQIAPGLTAGMGYNGRGVGMGTMMGIALAQSIYDRASCEFPQSKPATFALHKFHSAGASMTVKWLALRDHLDSLF